MTFVTRVIGNISFLLVEKNFSTETHKSGFAKTRIISIMERDFEKVVLLKRLSKVELIFLRSSNE